MNKASSGSSAAIPKNTEAFFPLQIEAAVHLDHPGETCAFFKGTLFLEHDLKIDLPWASLDQIKVIPKIPMDSRHNAKVDYPLLASY